MIYAVGRGNKNEMSLIERGLREQTALSTDEQLDFVGLYSKEDLETFLKETYQADIVCTDVTASHGVSQAEHLRERYPNAAIILIADTTISPVSYMKPTILAAGLLLKPIQKDMMEQVLKEIFQCYVLQNVSEEVFVVDHREEKHRIPYSQILYFEARNKKIYVCTLGCEYGFYDTMDHLEELYSDRFVRCHRSFMVSRTRIAQIKLSQNCLTLEGGIEIPLSRSYKNQIKELM